MLYSLFLCLNEMLIDHTDIFVENFAFCVVFVCIAKVIVIFDESRIAVNLLQPVFFIKVYDLLYNTYLQKSCARL